MRYLAVILLCFCKGFCQNLTVADSATRQPIPYVAVKLGDNKGLYTNEQGKFTVSAGSPSFLQLNHIGYNDLNVELKKVKDTVFMMPKATVLDEIIINKNNKPDLILKPERKANNFGSYIISPKTELITIVTPSDKIKNSLIKEVSFYFSKNFEKINEKDKYRNTRAIIRINIYEVTDNKPETKIYSSSPIEISSYSKDNVTLNLSDSFIRLTDKGICFGLEMIGYSNGSDIIDVESVYVRPTLTERFSESFSSKTYVKYVFDEATNLISINELLKRGMSNNKEIERNLVFGLTVIPE